MGRRFQTAPDAVTELERLVAARDAARTAAEVAERSMWRHVVDAIAHQRLNVSTVARELGISHQAVSRRLRREGTDR